MVWGCPVASELQDGMPNSAEKYSVCAPREIQMPLWGKGFNSGGAGVTLNPPQENLECHPCVEYPLVEATSSKQDFGSEPGVWRRRSFKGSKKGKQGEE